MASSSARRTEQSILGIGYELILKGSDTGDQYELMRFVVPPGLGPPPHIHQLEDECFYVVSGSLNVLRGEQSISAVAGDSVHLPRSVRHAFRNESDDFTEFLCWVTPANLETFFGAFAGDWPQSDPQPPHPDDETIQAMMQAAVEHHIEMLLGQS